MKNLRMPAVFNKRRKAILGGSLVLVAIVALWVFLLFPRYQEEILDNRFHLLSFQVSHGAKHSIYKGNPLTEKVFAKLRRIGIHIGKPSRGYEISLKDPNNANKTSIQLGKPGLDTYFTEKNTYIFMMRFREDFGREGTMILQADLVGKTGKVISLPSTSKYSRGGKEHSSVWRVDDSRAMKDIDEEVDYYLRITLPERNLEVARIRLGKLQKWK